MGTLNPYEPPNATDRRPDKAYFRRSLLGTGLFALLLFVVFGLPASLLAAVVLAMLFVPVQALLLAVAFSRRKRDEGALRLRLLKSAIYGVMLVALFVYAGLDQRTARAQADEIVQACHSYEEKHGHLPEALSLLVPEFLPALRQDLGFFTKRYYFYSPAEEGGRGHFVYHPEPFIRSWYDFETRQWSTFGT